MQLRLVGVDVIKINASEDANAAGNAMANVDIPRLIDSSIIIGITILADTVALESVIFISDTLNTTTKSSEWGLIRPDFPNSPRRDPVCNSCLVEHHPQGYAGKH